MLFANEICPPEITRDSSTGTANFEVRGRRNHIPFSVTGSFPLATHASSESDPGDETSALRRLLQDIANTLFERG